MKIDKSDKRPKPSTKQTTKHQICMHKAETQVEIAPIFQYNKMWDKKQRRKKRPLCEMWLQIQSLELIKGQETQRNGTPFPLIGQTVQIPVVREREWRGTVKGVLVRRVQQQILHAVKKSI